MSEKLHKLQGELSIFKNHLAKYMLTAQEGGLDQQEINHITKLQQVIDACEFKIASLTIKDTSVKVLTDQQVEKAIRFWNNRLGSEHIKQIGQTLGVSTELGDELVQATAKFQQAKGLDVDGCPGDFTLQWLSVHPSGKGAGLEALIKSEDVLYMGMRSVSRNIEGAVVKATAGAKDTTLVLGSKQQGTVVVDGSRVDLTTDEGRDAFVKSLEGTSAAEQAVIAQLIQNESKNASDEFAQFIRQMHLAESGQKLFKRMILSGHSSGWSIWGDGDEGSISFKDLANVAKVFPNAFKQVEDLKIAGCNSGQETKLEQHLTLFPNLKTIWAYADWSPSPNTGSKYHIRHWLQGTDERGDDGLDEARKAVSSKSGIRDKNVATYSTETGDYMTDHGFSELSLEEIHQEITALESYYDKAYNDGKIERSYLNELQSTVNAFVGRNEARSHPDYQRFNAMTKHVLFLRHWHTFTMNFLKNKGQKVKAGYAEWEVEIPDLESMSRDKVLAHIKDLEPVGQKSTKAKELLVYHLVELNGPDSWA